MSSTEEISRMKETACHEIDKYAEELEDISQTIWENPELFYKEHKAHNLLTDFLERKGFLVERQHKLETAFRAVPSENKQEHPNIAILCEYDALPEIGHACGHNLIAEVGIGTSLGIRAALRASESSLGKLTVLGCPAEEAGGGKIDLIQAGSFDNVDVAMMAHPSPVSIAASKYLACTEAVITYSGRSSHAANYPWEGINALDAVVLAYSNISSMRQQCKPDWRIHGIIIKGGTATNVIPEECQLQYCLRSPTLSELNLLMTKATACFEGAATATGCTVDIKWDKMPYYDMLPNSTLIQLYKENCQQLGVHFTTNPEVLNKSSGSTDMGNVSHKVPSIHPNFSIGTSVGAHTRPFADAAGSHEAQAYVTKQCKALALTAVDIYTSPHLLEQAKAEFAEDIKEESPGAY